MAYENDKDVLLNMDDQALGSMVERGYISPAQANEARAMKQGEVLRQAQQAENDARVTQELQNPAVREDVNRVANAVQEDAFAGTGIPAQPVNLDAKLSPQLGVTAPTEAPAPAAPVPQATQEQMDIRAMESNAAAREGQLQAEQEAARQQTQMQLDAQAQAAAIEEAKKAMAEQQAKDVAAEKKVKEDLDADKAEWRNSIRQGIAIMMGAYSQGLTGAKSNPVVDYLEKKAATLAESKKYTAEQQVKLRELMLKESAHELDQKSKTISNMKSLEEIPKIRMDIEKGLADIEKTKLESAQLGSLSALGKKETLTEEDVQNIPLSPEGNNLRSRLIVVGKDPVTGKLISGVGRDEHTVRKLKETILPDMDKSKEIIKELVNLNDYFGNNPLKKIFAFDKIKESRVNQQMLVGAMRLAIFGPGVLTDTEQKLAKNILVDPSKLMSLASTNEAALVSVLDKLAFIRNNALRQEGIKVPLTQNEANVAAIKRQYPKMRDSDIIDVLRKDKQWVVGE